MNKIEFRGENKRFLESHALNRLLIGPSSSGKTYTAMTLIHLACMKYPGLKVLMARKSLPALRNSAFKTYESVVETNGHKDQIRILGETRPNEVHYLESSNYIDGTVYSGQSTIRLSQIDVLSSAIGAEYNLIYISEPCSEGLTIEEFELVGSRARLPQIGNLPKVIVEGSLPLKDSDKKDHWIYDLPDLGYKVFNPNIKDNPTLYGYTDLGKEYLKQLESLPEYMKESCLLGEWK